MKKRRKSAALADSVDRMFGYFALVVLLCAFTIMSLGAFLYLLAGALVIAVPAWISKRRRMRKESRRMAEVVARKSESLGSSRLRSVRGVALSLCEWAWEGLVGKEPYMIRSS